MAIFSREDFEQGFEVTPVRSSAYRSVFKRAFDIVFVVIIAAPVTLVVLLLALFVSLDGASPFYRQERVGKNGTRFS
ncbi:MAG: sugar transferase, partial [Shimia sp.]|nr:sugar transferase [Shimia sp.]